MDPAQIEEDSRAKLRRKALGNVRSLVESLDYNDKLDRKGERRFVIFAAIAVMVAIAAMSISALLRSSEPGDLEMARCVQAERVDAAWALKKELQRQHPEMQPTEMSKLVEQHYQDVTNAAHTACVGKLRKAS